LGHRVSVEHDPERALERARTEAPPVCLLDIGLPGMDGYELARRLRAQPATAHALLGAITGYGQDSDRRRAAEAGFDRHLVKPIDLDTLQDVLAGVGRPGAARSI
jgi:CheY-like chemotaxis protein